jgi:uncharacterized repeat protein (TIGR02543 family)
MKLIKAILSFATILATMFLLIGCLPTTPEIVKVTGVSILEDNQILEIDDQLQLAALITPENATNKIIKWESDDTNIAKVSENGLVTALSPGVANIAVITEDGAFVDNIKIDVRSQSTQPTDDNITKKYIINFTTLEKSSVENELKEVTINLFSDENRTNNIGNITTNEQGIAELDLSNGNYWFNAIKEGYSEYEGSFNVNNADLTVPTIYLGKVWSVTFVIVANTDFAKNSPIIYDKSYSNNPPLKGAVISIYSDSEKTIDDKIVTLNTNESGIAEINLSNSDYWFTATLDGEAYNKKYDKETGMFTVSSDKTNIIILLDPLYTIRFDTNGGSEIAIQNIPAGTTVAKPEDPEKVGYNFTGWYSDTNLTELFDFENNQITQDTIIYAGWTIKEYAVSFDVNGGTTITSQTVKHGEKATRPDSNPTKNNYNFDDWYTDETFNTAFDFGNTQITQDITIYAKWEEKTCLATLQADINALKAEFPATGNGDEDWRNGDGASYQLPNTTESGVDIVWNITVGVCPISGFDNSNTKIQFGYPITISPLGGISSCGCSITANIEIGECSSSVPFNVNTITETVQYEYYYSYSISAN